MSWNVINGVLRAILPAAFAFAVGKGWIGQSQVADLTAAVIAFAAAGWSAYTNIKTRSR